MVCTSAAAAAGSSHCVAVSDSDKTVIIISDHHEPDPSEGELEGEPSGAAGEEGRLCCTSSAGHPTGRHGHRQQPPSLHPSLHHRPGAGGRRVWLCEEPLLSALQDARAAAAAVQCQRCQPAEPPRLAYVTRSGSKAEGVSDGIIGGKNITSDFDIMLELGPLRWAAQTVSDAEPDVISPEGSPPAMG